MALPAFVDEANHLRWAAEIWQGRVVFPFSTAKGLTLYYLAAFLPFQNALWVGRAAIVLSSMLTLSGLGAIGIAWGRPALGLIAAGIYATMPWAFFHERLAISDPLVATVAVWITWSATVLLNRPRQIRRFNVLALSSLLLAAPLLKLSAITLLALPIGVVVICRRAKNGIGASLQTLIAPYLLAGIVLILVLGLTATRYDISGELINRADFSTASLYQQILRNLRDLVDWSGTYLGATILLPVIGVFLGLLQRSKIIVMAAVGILLAGGVFVVTADGAFSRYYLPMLAFASLAGAFTLDAIVKLSRNIRLRRGMILIFSLFITVPFARFAGQAYRNPAAIKLPQLDQFQYIYGWSAGYGIQEATQFSVKAIASELIPTVVYGQDLSTWSIMDLYWPETANGKAYELWDANAPGVIEVVSSGLPAYLVVDLARDKANFEGLEINPHEIARFERPISNIPVVVYRLEREPFQFPPP